MQKNIKKRTKLHIENEKKELSKMQYVKGKNGEVILKETDMMKK